MKIILSIILLIMAAFPAAAEEPYCNIRHFDESTGLSQRSVKKVVTDTTGMVWIATWNGLNRFDGNEFSVVRPGPGESARRYSSRFRDLQPMADGSVWCRIDDRIVRLDPATNRFDDIHTALEDSLGRRLEFSGWSVSADSTLLVMKCGDIYLTLTSSGKLTDTSPTRPKLDYASQRNRSIGDYPGFPFSAQAYGKEDAEGRVWIVTRSGEVAYAPRRGELATVIADLGITDGILRYSATDPQGGVWFCSNQGAHRVEMGTKPFTRLAGGNNGRILSAVRDTDERLWVAEPDRGAIAVYSADASGEPVYVGRDGSLTPGFTPFGRGVYSLAAAPASGKIWAGCKPEGLFSLTPSADGYDVEKVMEGNVYDLAFDRGGRLWVATNGSGVAVIDRPEADRPEATWLTGLPEGTSGVRRITILSDTLMLFSTTGGLLAFNPVTEAAHLHVTEVDRLSSLGCIAVTDALTGPDGRIYVATESGGVSCMSGNPMGEATFTPLHNAGYGMTDVAFALQTCGDKGLLSVNPGQLTLTPTDSVERASTTVFGTGFWQGYMKFSEMRPFDLGDGSLLLGTNSGGIVTRLDAADTLSPDVIFTSASIQGRRDTLLTPASAEITLGRDERSLTLRFSALDYGAPSEVRYSMRVNGEEWSAPSAARSLTLYDLEPGEYIVEVRATDHFGRLSGDSASLTVNVTPKWHETTLARLGFWLLGLLGLWGIWSVWRYIRSIKRRQREILAAYLKLMDRSEAPTSNGREENEKTGDTTTDEAPEVNAADKEFMQHVIDYVQAHIADPDAGVDDMAADVGVSRSGLTRKMKSLMGVSPADFLRQSRLKRACSLLSTTDMAVKEVAFDCGFADLNYFGKCFKSAYGKTPTAWRRDEN